MKKSGIGKGIAYVILGLLSTLGICAEAQVLESRVKDIAKLDGIQDNPLLGYGLVAGLAGTGDGRRGFTAQTLANLIAGMGINVLQPELITTEVVPDNVAAVMVMANLEPFARPGSRINATVVSIGKASSLQGGYLLTTPLKGGDGQVHGLAYGPVSIGGFVVATGGGGGGAAAVQKNHQVVGLIPGGVVVEGEPVIHEVIQPGPSLRWLLTEPDFKTASNLQRKINSLCSEEIANAEDASAIRVNLGIDLEGKIKLGEQRFDSLVDAIAFVDDILVETDETAKIVINERTGTIVGGSNIKVRNVVISHGSLNITVQQTPEVTPGGLFGTEPVVTTQAQATAEEDTGKVHSFEAATVGQVVSSLTSIGYSPRDIIAILQSMSAAGAIKAEIVMLQ
ncbi:MAG: flagellar basal body P-ring protein FlgI [bacterium]|jgi:flagellar P-ring protein precursor FlgI|nr:flagellar basal body P-ring protein FlgI [bacterium]